MTIKDLTLSQKYQIETIKHWNEQLLHQWLLDLGFPSTQCEKFLENHITGDCLLDLNHEILKEMEIQLVGERMKILILIKKVKQYLLKPSPAQQQPQLMIKTSPNALQSKYVNLKSPASAPETTPPVSPQPTPQYSSNSLKQKPLKKIIPSPTLIQPIKSVASAMIKAKSEDVLGFHSSKDSINSQKQFSQSSLELNSGSGKKKRVVRVIGDDGNSRIVDITEVNDVKSLYVKVLNKFNVFREKDLIHHPQLYEKELEKWSLIVPTNDGTGARPIKESSLQSLGALASPSFDSSSVPKLFLRKKPAQIEPSQKALPKQRSSKLEKFFGERLVPTSASTPLSPSVSLPFSSPSPNVASPALSTLTINSNNGHLNNPITMEPASQNTKTVAATPPSVISNLLAHNKLQHFFGDRPPSELVTNNLGRFFPPQAPLAQPNNSPRTGFARLNNLEETENEEEEEEEDDIFDMEETEDELLSPISDESQPAQLVNQENPLQEEQKQRSLNRSLNRQTISRNEKRFSKTKKFKKIKWHQGALIGKGSFGNVYMGLNANTGELMAVKQVMLPANESGSMDPQAFLRKADNRRRQMVDALQREILLLKELEHPNIVRYLGSESTDECLNIFLEYVPGGSLMTILENYGKLEESLIRTFIKQILAGLAYLHDRNIVHRDIKGGNILVDNKGVVKITDFGISKKIAPPNEKDRSSVISLYVGVKEQNRTSNLQGSIFWMAPEVVKHYHYSKRSDIWSLGCLMIEMFTGKRPWPELSQMQAIYQIGSYTTPPLPENLSTEAQNFFKLCFALKHKERPNARELAQHPFLDELPEMSEASMTRPISSVLNREPQSPVLN